MLDSVDPLLRRRRRKDYDCRALVREAWLAHTDEDLADRPLRSFKRLDRPAEPCIVLFRRRNENHEGMFLRGKVLHMPGMTPRYERLDLASFGFDDVRFYR